MNEILENGIKIYQFPDSEGDEEEAAANKKLRVSTVSWSDQSFNCPDSSLTVLLSPFRMPSHLQLWVVTLWWR